MSSNGLFGSGSVTRLASLFMYNTSIGTLESLKIYRIRGAKETTTSIAQGTLYIVVSIKETYVHVYEYQSAL